MDKAEKLRQETGGEIVLIARKLEPLVITELAP